MTPEIPVENQKANTKAMEKEEHGKHNVFFYKLPDFQK
jgi:hypothetical protein